MPKLLLLAIYLAAIFLIIQMPTERVMYLLENGADGTQEYIYPWVTTADSLRLVYSPNERVIFLFSCFI
ncbi:hypothetical protein J7E81_23850 [Bacillus sp. ISL-18]|uniref:hypothetical protein n=1 Tax=Bacillus sp. ISL-18 TaxID=2819118 RepID=UPI001BE9146D|nr:hypothetical protein [Bacillus sp. ISL-18]MBT2658239.1 hypothetical protein [Bacillus sp. ISL-18]